MTRSAIVILAIFVILFFGLAVTTGKFLIPGWLLILLFVSSIKPLRGIAVTDNGVVLVSTSAWNAKPREVLAGLPPSSLAPTNVRKSGRRMVQVTLGPDKVRLRNKDFEPLASAVATMSVDYAYADVVQPSSLSSYGAIPEGVAQAVAAAPGWYPIGSDQYRQAYWDGHSWTAPKRWDGANWVDV
jgi:hypothetical protein